ncbi:MAG: diacylglycerol kinase family lipid kinase [Euzebyales bacterium]|nr:diacylglycerol kinase family lipid kinase [Euzebyales bacterium]MDQ3342042.1 diacylglycerol kinase family lipid kinase [Actinomycetota bacterium]
MRGLLLHNPNATSTSPAVTDVIARALSAELKLEVEATKRRDHASFLAAGAVQAGYEVVVALGGDGTVNEVLQGLAGTDVRLGILPGGSTNVWARSLGLPNDAVEATSLLLSRLRSREDRQVNLGSANGRYFGFTAGYGYDAEAVRYVERRYRLKRAVRQASFLWSGALAYRGGAGGRHSWPKTDITLSVEGEEPVRGLKSVVCCNTNPFTYLGSWPAQMCPDADLDKALDVTALTRISFLGLARIARTALTSAGVGRLRSLRLWHDRPAYDLDSATPLALQVDGDYIGEATRVALRSVPAALHVVA